MLHILKKQIRYKGKFHKVGDKIRIDKQHLAEFIKRGVIIGHTDDNKGKGIQQYSKEVKTNVGDNRASHDHLSIPEIKVLLDNQGIKYTSDMRKPELLELLGSD